MNNSSSSAAVLAVDVPDSTIQGQGFASSTGTPRQPSQILFRVLAAVSFCHLLNDMVQSLLPSIYPILKSQFHLDFVHLGLLTFTYQVVASLLQRLVAQFREKRPLPFALPAGMTLTVDGLLLLATAPTFNWLIVA